MSEQWTRVHPSTPALSSWQGIVAVVAIGAQIFINDTFGGSGLPNLSAMAFDTPRGLFALAVVGLFALIVVGSIVSWWVQGYRLDHDAVYYRRGLIVRQQRQARLDRLQSVEIAQPLIGRFFGLCALVIEVAGGQDSQVDIRFVRLSVGEKLRADILQAAARSESSTTPQDDAPATAEAEPEPEGVIFHQLDTGRLAGSIALTVGGVALVFTAVVAVPLASLLVTESLFSVLVILGVSGGILLTSALPLLLGALAYAWANFSTWYGYELRIVPRGFRGKAGLTSTRTTTILLDRVQAVSIKQPWWWRPTRWWRVKMNVAGFGVLGQDADKQSTLLPVAEQGEVIACLQRLFPAFGHGDPFAVADAGLRGTGGDVFSTIPKRARVFSPFAWPRTGYVTTRTLTVVRRGRFSRELLIIPHARVQSVGIARGPRHRLLGLCRVVWHSTPGPVVVTAPWLPHERAAALHHQQLELTLAAMRERSRHEHPTA